MSVATLGAGTDNEKLFGIELVPLFLIDVDERYQRDQGTAKEIEKLAAGWDERAASVITLSYRNDGRYWCIDGQRRVAAARERMGERGSLVAQVWIDLTPQEEARLFSLLQQRKQMSNLARFRADLFAGDQRTIAINAIIERHGFTVRAGHLALRELRAVRALCRIWAIDETGALLDRTLGILGKLQPERTVPGEIIEGLASMLARYDNVDTFRLHAVLAAVTIQTMIKNAAGIKANEPGLDKAVAAGRAIRDLYNRGLKSPDRMLGEWPLKMKTVATRKAAARRAEMQRGRPRPVANAPKRSTISA